MCIMRESKLRFLPLALFGLAAGGCGDSTDTGDVLADLNVPEITEVMEALAAPIEASAEANSVLASFFDSVTAGIPIAARSTLLPLADSPVRPFSGAGSFRVLTGIPAELLGRTFVWSTTEETWVSDDSRAGAPADGLRVIWYALDQGGNVAVPLVERGYIDVRDVSTPALGRLAIEAVRTAGGTLTVADYVYGHGHSDDDVDWTDFVTVEGTFTDGADAVDLDLQLDEAGNWVSGDATYRWSIAFDGPVGSYTWVVDGAFNGETGSDTGTWDVAVNRDGVATILALQFEGVGDGSGTLSHRGVVIADVDMVSEGYVLGNPRGGSFTTEQVTRLETVISTMIFYAPLLLAPLRSLVFIPFLGF